MDGSYISLPPNIGLDTERIRILSEQGRARIEAENAVKEVERKEKQEKRMRTGGWKEKMEQGLKGMIRSVGVGKGNPEKEKGQGGEKKGDEII
ncbi:hypothetical protein MMC29_003033 [Sticta canariensis]|nr:hypothetical protein [Sticta canariensis]